MPEWLAQPAIDNTLQNVLRRLDEEQANLEQSSQVSFKNDIEKQLEIFTSEDNSFDQSNNKEN